MEFVDTIEPDAATLLNMEYALGKHVWNREPMDDINFRWFQLLLERVYMPPPPSYGTPCLTHGDCTVSNVMRRTEGSLVIVDPLPPRAHVPSVAEADMGRLIQSAMGWETLVYGQEVVDYEPPLFWFSDSHRRLALWWCACTAKRIALFERETRQIERLVVIDWCNRVAENCLDAMRV